MANHLSEIQLFEYANQLITDAEERALLTTHIEECTECKNKIAIEHKIDASIKKVIAVKQEVNVTKQVLNYFEKPAVKMVGVDVSWVTLVVFFISALLIVGEVTSFNKAIPQLTYTTVIASAIAALMAVDFFLKYLKYKKNSTS